MILDEVQPAPVQVPYIKPDPEKANPKIGVGQVAFSRDNRYLATKNGMYSVANGGDPCFCTKPRFRTESGILQKVWNSVTCFSTPAKSMKNRRDKVCWKMEKKTGGFLTVALVFLIVHFLSTSRIFLWLLQTVCRTPFGCGKFPSYVSRQCYYSPVPWEVCADYLWCVIRPYRVVITDTRSVSK